MGIKYSLTAFVNRILAPLGARLERVDSPEPWEYQDLKDRYARLVHEASGCLEDLLFRDLPAAKGRDELLAQLVGTNISEAMWLLSELHRVLDVEGDVCEFGIAEGATSALLANEIRSTNKNLWLFDSFQGLSKPTAKDVLIHDIFYLGSMSAYEGRMRYAQAEVLGRLAAVDFPRSRTKIVAGFVDETLRTAALPPRVAFAYVDFDFYEPILAALRFLRTVVPPGGVVIVDDYGFFSAGAKAAVDEFAREARSDFRLVLPPSWAGYFAVLSRIGETCFQEDAGALCGTASGKSVAADASGSSPGMD